MKKLIFIFSFLIWIGSLYSQDLIVTQEFDSINCKITRANKDELYFTYRTNNEVRKTMIPRDQVRSYQFNYFKQSYRNVEPGPLVNISNLRFAFHGGYSYRLAPMSPDIPDVLYEYTRKLKSGYNLGLAFNYYIKKNWGIGLTGSLFKSSNSISGIEFTDNNGNTVKDYISNKVSIYFIAPTFSSRFLIRQNRDAFLINIAMGYMYYKETVHMLRNYDAKKGTFGASLDVGYDIGLGENLALGFMVSVLLGTARVDSEGFAYKEGLSRLDLTIGLRFNN